METNETPEKIYVKRLDFESAHGLTIVSMEQRDDAVEYIRADAFIEKSCKFLQEEVLDDYSGIVWEGIIEDFINYIKGN